MWPKGYHIHNWLPLNDGNMGMLRTLTRKRMKKTSNMHLWFLNEMASNIASQSTKYCLRDKTREYIFAYGERQLDSILVPAFWDVVGSDGLVLVQCPTERTMPNPTQNKTHKGWVDYWLKKDDMVFVFEIKVTPSSQYLGPVNKHYIYKSIDDHWNKSIYQLDEINTDRQIHFLGEGSDKLLKVAVLFIPIFISSRDQNDLRIKQKKDITNLIQMERLSQLNPKPDWMTCWLLPNELQQMWDDENQKKYWHSPVVFILAKLCEEFEYIGDKQGWKKIK